MIQPPSEIKLAKLTLKDGVMKFPAGILKDGTYDVVLVPSGVDMEYCAQSYERCG